MKRYRVAVIGCGSIGVMYEADIDRPSPKSHAGAVASNTRTELVALVDTNAALLQAAHNRFPHTHTYTSFRECFKSERPDIVIIATPTSTHAKIVEETCLSGIPIIVCEKPLCVNVTEATAIKQAAEEAGTTFVLNYQRRFFPLFSRVKKEINRGAFGIVQQVTCYYSNGVNNNGSHAIDSVLYLLGERIAMVSAIEDERGMHPNGDLNVSATLITLSGIRISLQCFNQQYYAIHEMHIYGSKGGVSLSEHGYKAQWRTIKKKMIPYFKNRKFTRNQRSFVSDSLAHAIHCYEKQTPPASGIENGSEIISILAAICESTRHNGKAVAVRYS